MLDLKTDL